jgi:hypothetical protein
MPRMPHPTQQKQRTCPAAATPNAKTSPDADPMKKTLRSFLTGNAPKPPAARPGTGAPTKRAVWRISESAPMGEWVDPDALPELTPLSKAPPREASSSGWIESSMDLLNGTDVSEDHDGAPGELFDDVNARQRGPKRD